MTTVYRNGRIGDLAVGRLFHGGGPGLQPGEEVLPSAQTGVMTIGDLLLQTDPYAHVRELRTTRARDREWAFAGSRREATRYAALWSLSPLNDDEFGTLYEVLPPDGSAMMPDPGSLRALGEAWICERVTVVQVVDDRVNVETAKAMGIAPPGVPTAGGWRDVERYTRALGRARAEGRQLTWDEHVGLVKAEAQERVTAATATAAGAGSPAARYLARRGLGLL